MPLHDLIPAAMLAVAVVSIVATLIDRQKTAGRAVIVLLVLFVVSLWFPEPTPDYPYMHWFPASLAVLMVALPAIAAAAVIGWISRLLYRVMFRGGGTRQEPETP